MIYGKVMNTSRYGFFLDTKELDTYVDIPQEEYQELIRRANEEQKLIVPDDNGYPSLAELPKPSESEEINRRIEELENYLSSTDWYAIRFADEGTEIPPDIKQERKKAREEISRLRNLIKE